MEKASKVLMLALVMIAMVGGTSSEGVRICNIESDNFGECFAAVTGKSPPPPTKQCCALIHKANLRCLCDYRAVLPAFGIDPARAMKLPKKCGLKTPPNCRMP